MDILYALVKTFGYLVSIGIAAIIPVLFGMALLNKLPWLIAAPAMALVAFIAAYPAGMLEGIGIERVAWEMKIAKLQAKLDANKYLAEQKLLAIEKKYLQSESEKAIQRQLHNDELDRLFDQSQHRTSTKKESQNDGTKSYPVCQPYSMRVDPGILRNIQKR